MAISIFLSRSINDKSIFVEAIKFHLPKVDIFGASLIDLSPIPFKLPKEFDGCFFYSQNAVSFFLDQLDQPALTLNNKFIGAFGKATAHYIEKQGYLPQFIGSGELASDALEILKTLRGKALLFPQAMHSKNSLRPFLSDHLEYISLKVYQNEMKEIETLPKFNILTFTSPLNVESYQRYRSFEDEQLFAIGKTTAAAIRKYTDHPITIAEYPSEKHLALAVIKALKK